MSWVPRFILVEVSLSLPLRTYGGSPSCRSSSVKRGSERRGSNFALDLQEGDLAGSLLTGFFEPGKGLILVTESNVDPGDQRPGRCVRAWPRSLNSWRIFCASARWPNAA